MSDYEKTQELREIYEWFKELKPGEEYRAGFLAGRAFEITNGMHEHPEWWDRGCNCNSCKLDAYY